MRNLIRYIAKEDRTAIVSYSLNNVKGQFAIGNINNYYTHKISCNKISAYIKITTTKSFHNTLNLLCNGIFAAMEYEFSETHFMVISFGGSSYLKINCYHNTNKFGYININLADVEISKIFQEMLNRNRSFLLDIINTHN
jgi:hypothetical protein